MKEGSNNTDNSATALLEGAASEYFDSLEDTAIDDTEEVQPEVEEDLGEEGEVAEPEEENNNDTSNDVDTSEEVDHKEENEGSTPDLDKELSGFNQEFRDAVNLVEDTELKDQLIGAGKKQLANIDRKHQELGESKKLVDRVNDAFTNSNLSYTKHEYVGVLEKYIGFDAAFTKDPQNALEILAKSANIDLSNLSKTPVPDTESSNDLDDYRTPEEIALENRLKVLEDKGIRTEQEIKQKELRTEREASQTALSDFINSKDSEGNLKYPHFEVVREDMSLLITKPGMDLEKAYSKAILLNDDLRSERDSRLTEKATERRKANVDRAKRLRKQSPRSTNTSVRTSNPKVLLQTAVSDYFSS